jgi:death-on-curing protein
MESLINNHPFIDGNKRTSVAAASLFLLRNDFRLKASQRELERFTLNFALKKISLENAVNWFERNSVKVEENHERSGAGR